MKILVYGWYHQYNIGDNLFITVFKKFFPNDDFIFQDNIKLQDLQNVDAIFFGGGSFLLEKPNITNEALVKIKKIPIFYLGIGVEDAIHPIHIELINHAKIVATRSINQLDRLKILNSNSIWIPDLVYALQSQVKISSKINRSVLVIPNISVVPNHLEPYWKHASWSHFKSEFAQFLDSIVEEGYHLDFLSLCQGHKNNDTYMSNEIIGHMVYRNNYVLNEYPTSIEAITELISKYSLVITQRFHGIILSEMTKTPYIAIHHHDKLKYSYPANGTFLSYYSSAKQDFFNAFNQTLKMNFDNPLPIESNIFEDFIQKIIELVENGSLCRN